MQLAHFVSFNAQSYHANLRDARISSELLPKSLAAVDLSRPSQDRQARSSGRYEGEEWAPPRNVGLYICQFDCLKRWVKSRLQGSLSLAREFPSQKVTRLKRSVTQREVQKVAVV